MSPPFLSRLFGWPLGVALTHQTGIFGGFFIIPPKTPYLRLDFQEKKLTT
jgi:hypothetical protein